MGDLVTTDASAPPWAEAVLSERDFTTLSAFIRQHCGINYPPAKRVTLEARLRKRLRALRLAAFSDYVPHVVGPQASADEVVRMIDEVTTNKTDFFREAAHFEQLVGTALPALASDAGAGTTRDLVVWSAACSSGEEVYTLAMVLENAGGRAARLRYRILGTDICTEVLETARRAIYDEKLIEPVPPEMRQRYLLRSRQRGRGLVRIAPALRAKVRFAQLNLLAPFTLRGRPDVIFCRNVLIYFDRATQRRVLECLCRALRPGGYLFLGHSDSTVGLELPLASVMPSVYRKPREGNEGRRP